MFIWKDIKPPKKKNMGGLNMEHQVVIFYEKETKRLIAVVNIERAVNAWKWIKAKGYKDGDIFTEVAVLNNY